MKCPYCKKKFGILSKEVHSGGTKKTCSNCGKEFSVHRNLTKLFIFAVPTSLPIFLFLNAPYKWIAVFLLYAFATMLSTEEQALQK